ncbi:MAG TPA: serine O-acetyltransferase EpsC [Burkholderiaceae bacterium]|nr:serine O-acetyltransferase EpsC [Burkholderiaceae bacterium]
MLVESLSLSFESRAAANDAVVALPVPTAGARRRRGSGVWSQLRKQARAAAAGEPPLRRMLDDAVLSHDTPAQIVSGILARRLGAGRAESVHAVLLQVLSDDPDVLGCLEADLAAVSARDPACRSSLHALLHLKGFHALQAHRVAHSLWRQGRRDAAHWVASQVATALAVDIHPAVPIGPGVMLDHATGIVIGETAVVEAGVSILHGVTLGATGKQRGDRHPKVRRGATLGAGATILGNIEVGCMSTVGAGSVVVRPVPPHCTVAGVPATVVRASVGSGAARTTPSPA